MRRTAGASRAWDGVRWLAAATLVVLGCAADPDARGDDAPANHGSTGETGSASTSSSSGSTTPADPSASTTMDATTSTSTTTTDSEPSTTTPGTDTSDDSGRTESGTTGEPLSEDCVAGCVVEVMCGNEWASEQDCATWCDDNLDEAALFSPFCRDAWEGRSACLATLTCEAYAAWFAQDPPKAYPCFRQDITLQYECAGQ